MVRPNMFLRNGPRQLRNIVYCAIVVALIFILQFSQRLHRIVASHTYDLNYPSIYRTQFQVYILTHACDRLTADITSNFDSVVIVADVEDNPRCEALNQMQLHTPQDPALSLDDNYRDKYIRTLNDCATGNKMKCLILEDDVVLLHDLDTTRRVLVENTLTLFNHEESAWDCTKRGLGWLSSGHTGMGSQCRIYSMLNARCMSECLTDSSLPRLDSGLKQCQITCGLIQKRFLLAVHSGLQPTIVREAQ